MIQPYAKIGVFFLTLVNYMKNSSQDGKKIRWSIENIKKCVVVIVVISMGTVFVDIAAINPITENHYSRELSNNVTIAIETALGLSLVIIVYGLTSIEKQKTDTRINNIHKNIMNLSREQYQIRLGTLTTIKKQVDSLLDEFKELKMRYEEIDNTPKLERNRNNMKSPVELLKGHYDIIGQLIDNIPVLRADNNIISMRVLFDNLDNDWKREDWEKLLKELNYIMKPKITVMNYANELETEINNLKSLHEQFLHDMKTNQSNL